MDDIYNTTSSNMQNPFSFPSPPAVPARLSVFNNVHARISNLFHDTSTQRNGPFPSSHTSKPPSFDYGSQSHQAGYTPQLPASPTVQSFRSPSSTRSVIDPTSSPTSSTRPITVGSYLRLITSPPLHLQSDSASATVSPDTQSTDPCQARRARPRRQGQRRRRRHRTAAKQSSVRQKVLILLFSGISLCTVLAICKISSHPVPCVLHS